MEANVFLAQCRLEKGGGVKFGAGQSLDLSCMLFAKDSLTACTDDVNSQLRLV